MRYTSSVPHTTHSLFVLRTYVYTVHGHVHKQGLLSLEEFVQGVQELLKPNSARAESLAKRLKAGRIHEGQQGFEHIKTVAIIGAGVAGLQTARCCTEVAFTVCFDGV